MTDYYDELETRTSSERESDLFARLPTHLNDSVSRFEGLASHLLDCDLSVTNRSMLSSLPVLRKPELMKSQTASPPFGGFANLGSLTGGRIFASPGPVWEPEGIGEDSWGAARALFAAGFRSGDVVHNALSYHMTPGGFIIDSGLRALGCMVFPAGVGNTELQIEAAGFLRPAAYVGTPDFLKVMLDKAAESNIDLSCITRGLVSGGALFPSLRSEYKERGVEIMQAYATADLGVIAYETSHDGEVLDGMIVNENLVVEICRPGTGDVVADGEVGELVVTNFSSVYPLVRFGTGDLSAIMSEPSPCGRTNVRIRGWLGRADQRTKVKGMFVDPEQIAKLTKRFEKVSSARLVVTRDGESDVMRLLVTPVESGATLDTSSISNFLKEITQLSGEVEQVAELPNDGKVISDERDYEN